MTKKASEAADIRTQKNSKKAIKASGKRQAELRLKEKEKIKKRRFTGLSKTDRDKKFNESKLTVSDDLAILAYLKNNGRKVLDREHAAHLKNQLQKSGKAICNRARRLINLVKVDEKRLEAIGKVSSSDSSRLLRSLQCAELERRDPGQSAQRCSKVRPLE